MPVTKETRVSNANDETGRGKRVGITRRADNRERFVRIRVRSTHASMLNYAACIFSGLFGGSQSLTGNPAACAHAHTLCTDAQTGWLVCRGLAERAKIFQFHSRLRPQESHRERRISLEWRRFQTENRIMMLAQRETRMIRGNSSRQPVISLSRAIIFTYTNQNILHHFQ